MTDKKDLRLHIHNDVELLTSYPLAFTAGAEGYVMQESRVVYIGSLKGIEAFVKARDGSYCQSMWPQAETR